MVVADAFSYLTDPLVIVGFVLFLAFLAVRQLVKSGTIALPAAAGSQGMRLLLNQGFILGLLVMAVGIVLHAQEPRTEMTSPGSSGEVDFGFVELEPGMEIPIPSYKNGGEMVVYAGEDFAYQVVVDGEQPPIELHAGDHVQVLSGAEGKVKIDGPPNKPLPAVLIERDDGRESLPGSAPPRTSVKVQVYGAARPE